MTCHNKVILLPFFLLLLTLLHIILSHQVLTVQHPALEISGFVHQPKDITIPFSKCFKVDSELPANQKFIHFTPTSLSLTQLKKYTLKNSNAHLATFDDIRSTFTFKHNSILIFTDYILLFSTPNLVTILAEQSSQFVAINSYTLDLHVMNTKTSMYKFNEKAFVTLPKSEKVYILSQKGYEQYTLPQTSSLTHFVEIKGEPNQFFACEFFRGLTKYSLDPQSKTISISKRYGRKELGLPTDQVFLVDFTLNYYNSSSSIYVLDAQKGVIRLRVNSSESSKNIINRKNCQSFDSITESHFVLLCQGDTQSTIIEAYEQQVDYNHKHYQTIQPILHSNYLLDLHVDEQFYLIYSRNTIQVFWSIVKNRLPEHLTTQSQLSLPGLETFAVHKEGNNTHIYTVEAGEFIKYTATEAPPKLSLISDEPIVKSFKLGMYGSCSELFSQSYSDSGSAKTCKISQSILLKVIEEDYPIQQSFSISASIIVILIIVFLLVIWICLKKYKRLEQQARKVLQNYKKKKNKQRRPI